ncbi:MAG: hypothetical protein K0R39_1959 [Symbiobacteriaceae bacterium]|jgi:hypothetical protein|nr:hypothetical protein [Symbiobacteriaceae bacterium]
MPEDDFLTEPLLSTYQEIISELSQHKDPVCIRPLIDSFGYGEAQGVYWSVVHLLESFPPEMVVPELLAAVQTRLAGPCLWAAYMLGRSRSAAAVPHLTDLLKHDKPLVRAGAVMALGMIGEAEGLKAVQALREDPDPEVRNEVRHVLSQQR